MRKRYAASFAIGEPGGGTPSLEDVSQACLDWACGRRSRRSPSELGLTPAADIQRVDLDRGWLEAISAEDSGRRLWAMRLVHPDQFDPGIEWHTEIALSALKAGPVQFSCTLLLGGNTGRVMPTWRPASRPRIVRDVVERWPCSRGLPLGHDCRRLGTNDVPAFVQELRSAKRELPTVLISVRNVDNRPGVDPRKVADWLAGSAHVVVCEDKLTSAWGLRDHLPARMGCWDGAARIYWPGFSSGNAPERHRVWAHESLRHYEDNRKNGFREVLLGYISEAAVFAKNPSSVLWTDVETARRKASVSAARSAGDLDQLLELADEEIAKLKEELRETEEERDSLFPDLRAAQSERDSWRSAYEDLRAGSAAEDSAMYVPLGSTKEAVSRARESFPDALCISLNNASTVRDSLYDVPDEVFAALEFLATTYCESKRGVKPCADFDQALREVNGWKFLGRQSKYTMGEFESWYETQIDGRKIKLTDHIGTGSSKDPRRTIRIGFCWDAEAEKVIVGFIGQHQRTRAT